MSDQCLFYTSVIRQGCKSLYSEKKACFTLGTETSWSFWLRRNTIPICRDSDHTTPSHKARAHAASHAGRRGEVLVKKKNNKRTKKESLFKCFIVSFHSWYCVLAFTCCWCTWSQSLILCWLYAWKLPSRCNLTIAICLRHTQWYPSQGCSHSTHSQISVPIKVHLPCLTLATFYSLALQW